jgi:hypothetical protein
MENITNDKVEKFLKVTGKKLPLEKNTNLV